jgi:O-antigen/teichoic acid export membrane protein
MGLALNSVITISGPKFAELYRKGDLDGIRDTMRASVRVCLLPAGGSLLVILLFARPIMGLFGPEFVEGASVLRILAIGQFVNAATGPVGLLLTMTGNERDTRNIVLAYTLFLLVACALVAPRWGILGTAVVNAFAVAFLNFFAVYFVHKRLGLEYRSMFGR